MAKSILLPALSEMIGMLFWTLLGGLVVQITGSFNQENINCTRVATIALADGFLFYALIYLTMKMSNSQGGYFNPAVTLALLPVDIYAKYVQFRDKKTDIFLWEEPFQRTCIYLLAQLLGAITGASLLAAMPNQETGKLGMTMTSLHESDAEAFAMEASMTFLLVFIILSVRFNEERKASILIGFALMSMTLVSFPLSGGSMNPARSLGPAALSGVWTGIWIYLTAPFLGGILASLSFILFRYDELKFI